MSEPDHIKVIRFCITGRLCKRALSDAEIMGAQRVTRRMSSLSTFAFFPSSVSFLFLPRKRLTPKRFESRVPSKRPQCSCSVTDRFCAVGQQDDAVEEKGKAPARHWRLAHHYLPSAHLERELTKQLWICRVLLRCPSSFVRRLVTSFASFASEVLPVVPADSVLSNPWTYQDV